jgi:hypothetical protein
MSVKRVKRRPGYSSLRTVLVTQNSTSGRQQAPLTSCARHTADETTKPEPDSCWSSDEDCFIKSQGRAGRRLGLSSAIGEGKMKCKTEKKRRKSAAVAAQASKCEREIKRRPERGRKCEACLIPG